jgi:hypothetical protein
VQDLREELDEEGKPLLDQYTFLTWFLSEGEFEGIGDPVAEEIRTAIWPNPIHFFTGGVSIPGTPLHHLPTRVLHSHRTWSCSQLLACLSSYDMMSSDVNFCLNLSHLFLL